MTLFSSINQLEGTMGYHRDRHSVLSGNVANVDTPGYRPMDLRRVAPSEVTFDASLIARTSEGHLQPGNANVGLVEKFDDTTSSVGADGNGVTLDRELAKIDANRIRYTASSELVNRRFALLRYAASDGLGG